MLHFLDLDIEIKDVFAYKLVDKRDAFVPSKLLGCAFYGAIFSEILQIIKCTLKFEYLKPRL